MTESKVNFTEERLRNFTCEEGKTRTFFIDAEQPGLRLAVTPTGTKTFQARAWHRIKQRPVTLTLGGWPGMPLDDARQRTKAFIAEIASGNDPQLEKIQQRSVPTVAEMLHSFLEEYSKPHKQSWQSDESIMRLYLLPAFGHLRVDELTRDMVTRWHGKTAKQYSGPTANRRLALLRSAYNKMQPKRDNPCVGVKQFVEVEKDRFLHPAEIGRFLLAVEQERCEGNPDTADFVMMVLFTGARRSNVLAMYWKDIDLELAIWRIPAAQSKNKKALTLPLAMDAIEILARRRAATNSMFVFPGSGRSGHAVNMWKGFDRIRKRANLPDITIHTLRHNLGSWQASNNSATPIIGRALGHRNHSSTMRYIHLTNDPVRSSVQAAIDLMKAAAAMPEEQKVTPIRKQG